MIGAPGFRERRACFERGDASNDGAGGNDGATNNGSGDNGTDASGVGGGLGGGNADPGGTYGPDGGAEGSTTNWGGTGFESSAGEKSFVDGLFDGINSVIDAITGKPTGDRVLDAFIGAALAAVPGAGLAMAGARALSEAGVVGVQDYGAPGTTGGYGGGGGYQPPIWRTPAPNPLAASPYASNAAPDWAGMVPPSQGPYAQPGAPGAQAAVSASDGTPAASGASTDEKSSLLPLLLLGAGILAGFA